MPKAANQFDFDTIADIILTIEYTCEYDTDYYDQVKSKLSDTVDITRVFSFRNQFPDLWYELRNSTNDSGPANNINFNGYAGNNVTDTLLPTVSLDFQTARQDFPPNIDDMVISAVGLYIAGAKNKNVVIDNFRFVDENAIGNGSTGGDGVGGSAQASPNDDGLISTPPLKGNAMAWNAICNKKPFGQWTLQIKDQPTLELLKSDQVSDIIFILTIKGRTPPWP